MLPLQSGAELSLRLVALTEWHGGGGRAGGRTRRLALLFCKSLSMENTCGSALVVGSMLLLLLRQVSSSAISILTSIPAPRPPRPCGRA